MSLTVQYRVQISKGNENVDGPDGADLVITVPIKVAQESGFDPDRGIHERSTQSGGEHWGAVR